MSLNSCNCCQCQAAGRIAELHVYVEALRSRAEAPAPWVLCEMKFLADYIILSVGV
mgnify:CR=1 FL=1